MAEQLYLHLIASETDKAQNAAEILLETAWSDDFADAKTAQAQIKACLEL